jgi:hypothetical protein
LSKTAKKKPYPQALALGALSIVSYYFLFTHVNQVMEYFVRGGAYAILPIVTALYFSIVYGSFASTVISITGLKAAKGAGH